VIRVINAEPLVVPAKEKKIIDNIVKGMKIELIILNLE